MALGNGNPKYGDKGSNWSYEFKSLTQLKNIKDAIDALTAITSAAQDYEANVVVDSLGVAYLEVRSFDEETGALGTPQYYFPGTTTPATPTPPLKYINPNTLLQDIVTNTTGVARTTGMLRPNNTSGNLNTEPGASTFFSVSVANVGAVDGTVLGQTIKPNESLNFSADAINNYFSSFTYDATGTEFILIYVY